MFKNIEMLYNIASFLKRKVVLFRFALLDQQAVWFRDCLHGVSMVSGNRLSFMKFQSDMRDSSKKQTTICTKRFNWYNCGDKQKWRHDKIQYWKYASMSSFSWHLKVFKLGILQATLELSTRSPTERSLHEIFFFLWQPI